MLLDGDPRTYVRFAQEYFELNPSEAAVSAVYRSEPLSPAILAELNADAQYEDVCEQLDAMGLSGA